VGELPRQNELEPNDHWTLGDTRDWLRRRLEDGEHCPCCTQFAKVYRRKITSTSARALITMFRAGAQYEPKHLPTVLGRKQADETKMAYWGLIQEESAQRSDGGRAGWWQITELGVEWIHGRVAMPRYARIYDGRCLALVGEPTTIQDCLGTRFNLSELMTEEATHGG
jgi:hypothetical protein